jgi:hypothetical protein
LAAGSLGTVADGGDDAVEDQALAGQGLGLIKPHSLQFEKKAPDRAPFHFRSHQ